MKEKKKPDYVVFDETTQKYNANILPYATSLGAPSIQIEDISIWKKINVSKVNHQLKTKFEKLKEEYEAMMEQFEYNHLVYNSSYNFEPVVGGAEARKWAEWGRMWPCVALANHCAYSK